MTDLERLASTEVVPTPEMATLDCGTCNFGGDEVFTNTDNTIINFAKILKERGIKPELEVFDKGMIDIALKTADRKGLLVHPSALGFRAGRADDRYCQRPGIHGRDPFLRAPPGPRRVSARTRGTSLLPPSPWADTSGLDLRTICIWKRAFWRRATARW